MPDFLEAIEHEPGPPHRDRHAVGRRASRSRTNGRTLSTIGSRCTSSACRWTSAPGGAAWTWGRRPAHRRHRRDRSPASATAWWTRATSTTPIPETRDRGDPRKKYIARDRGGVPSGCAARRWRASRRARCRWCSAATTASAAGSVAAAAAARARSGAADQPALGGRARRHEHAEPARTAATSTACRWRRSSARNPRSCRASGGVLPDGARRRGRS